MTHNFVNFKFKERYVYEKADFILISQSLVIQARNLDSSTKSEILGLAKQSFQAGLKMINRMLGIGDCANDDSPNFANYLVMGELLCLATETALLNELWNDMDNLIVAGKSRLSGKTQHTCRMKYCEALGLFQSTLGKSYIESGPIYQSALNLLLSGMQDLDQLRSDEEGRQATNYLIINGSVHFWNMIKSKILKTYARSFVQQFRSLITYLETVTIIKPQMANEVTPSTVEMFLHRSPGSSKLTNMNLLHWCLWRVSLYLGSSFVEFDAGDAQTSHSLCDKGLRIVSDLDTEFISPIASILSQEKPKSPHPVFVGQVAKLNEYKSSLLQLKVYVIKDKPPADIKKMTDSWNCTDNNDVIWIRIMNMKYATSSSPTSVWNDPSISSCPSLFTQSRLSSSSTRADVSDSDIRNVLLDSFPSSDRSIIAQYLDGTLDQLNVSASSFVVKCACNIAWICVYCRKFALAKRLTSLISKLSSPDPSTPLWMQIVVSYVSTEEIESVDSCAINGIKASREDLNDYLLSKRMDVADKLNSTISSCLTLASSYVLHESCICLWNIIFPILASCNKKNVMVHLKTIKRALDRTSSPLNELKIQVHVVLSEIELELGYPFNALREASEGLRNSECFPSAATKQAVDFCVDNQLTDMCRVCKLKDDVSLGKTVSKFELLEVQLEALLVLSKKKKNLSDKDKIDINRKVLALVKEFSDLLSSITAIAAPSSDVFECFIKNHPGKVLDTSEVDKLNVLLMELLSENPRKFNGTSYVMPNSETKRRHRKFLLGVCKLLLKYDVRVEIFCRQFICMLFHPSNCESSSLNLSYVQDLFMAVIYLARTCMKNEANSALFVQCMEYCIRNCKKFPEISFVLDSCSRLITQFKSICCNDAVLGIYKRMIVDLIDSETYATTFIVRKDIKDNLVRSIREGRFGVCNFNFLIQFISSYVNLMQKYGARLDDGFISNILKKLTLSSIRSLYPLLKSVSSLLPSNAPNLSLAISSMVGQDVVTAHPLSIPSCLLSYVNEKKPSQMESKSCIETMSMSICDEYLSSFKIVDRADSIGDYLIRRANTLLDRDLDDVGYRCWILARSADNQLRSCNNYKKAIELSVKCLRFMPTQANIMKLQHQVTIIAWVHSCLLGAQSFMNIGKFELIGSENSLVLCEILLQGLSRMESASKLLYYIQDVNEKSSLASNIVNLVCNILLVNCEFTMTSSCVTVIESILESLRDCVTNKQVAQLYLIVAEKYFNNCRMDKTKQIISTATKLLPRSTHSVFWKLKLTMNDLSDDAIDGDSNSSIKILIDAARSVSKNSVQARGYKLAQKLAKPTPYLHNMIQLHKAETFHQNGCNYEEIVNAVGKADVMIDFQTEICQAVLVSRLTCSIASMLLSCNMASAQEKMAVCMLVIERILKVLVSSANTSAAYKSLMTMPMIERLSLASEEEYITNFVKFQVPTNRSEWCQFDYSNEAFALELREPYPTLRERFLNKAISNAESVVMYLKRMKDYCLLDGFDEECLMLSLLAKLIFKQCELKDMSKWDSSPSYIEERLRDDQTSLAKWTSSIIDQSQQLCDVQNVDKSVNLLFESMSLLSTKIGQSVFALQQWTRLLFHLTRTVTRLCENCFIFRSWRSTCFFLKEISQVLEKMEQVIRNSYSNSKSSLLYMKGLTEAVQCIEKIRHLCFSSLPKELSFLDQFELWLIQAIIDLKDEADLSNSSSSRSKVVTDCLLSLSSSLLCKSIVDREHTSNYVDSFFSIKHSSNAVEHWLNETEVLTKPVKPCHLARKVQSIVNLVSDSNTCEKISLAACQTGVMESSTGQFDDAWKNIGDRDFASIQSRQKQILEDVEAKSLHKSFSNSIGKHDLALASLSSYLLMESLGKSQTSDCLSWMIVNQSIEMSRWLNAVAHVSFSINPTSAKSINFQRQQDNWSAVSYPDLLPWFPSSDNSFVPMSALSILPSNLTVICLCCALDFSSIFIGVANSPAAIDKNLVDRLRLDDEMKFQLSGCLETMETIRSSTSNADTQHLLDSVKHDLSRVTQDLIGKESRLSKHLSTLNSNHFALLVDPLLMTLPWELVGSFQTASSLTRDFSFMTLVARLNNQAQRETVDVASKKPKRVDVIAIIDPFYEDNSQTEDMALKRLSKSSLVDASRQTSIETAQRLIAELVPADDAKLVHFMNGNVASEVSYQDAVRSMQAYSDISIIFDGPARLSCFLSNAQLLQCQLKHVRCFVVFDRKNNHSSFIRQSKKDNSFTSDIYRELETSSFMTAAMATLAGCRGVVVSSWETDFVTSKMQMEQTVNGLVRDKLPIGRWSEQCLVWEKGLVVFGLPALVGF